jgi:ABC-type sugar transport system ATPase subunit
VDDGVIVLEGSSASGKSTILRLLAGIESPAEGRILINGQEIKNRDEGERKSPYWLKVGSTFTQSQSEAVAQPVILENKPDFNNSKTVLQRIVQMGHDAVQYHCNIENVECRENEIRDKLLQRVALEFAELLTISKEQQFKPSELSPSKQFLFAMACGCMVSIAPSIAALGDNAATKVSVQYPILLFDELFDTETSGTLDKCKSGICNLIEKGGVVVSVTHRTTYFMDMGCRCVTMSGGKVLVDSKVLS